MTLKIILLSVLILGIQGAFAQTVLKITDADSHQPIPFAKVIFQDGNYRNSEQNGEILMEPYEMIKSVEMFGYEDYKPNNFTRDIELKRLPIEIETVVFHQPKRQNTYTLGKIKTDFPSHSFSSSNRVWTVLNYFKPENLFPENLFIKKISFENRVEKTGKPATINLVIYKISGEKWKNFVITCKPGKNVTQLDLSNLKIPFPKEGFYIGFEWIKTLDNSFEQKFSVDYKDGTKKTGIMSKINPSIFSHKIEVNKIFTTDGKGKIQELKTDNSREFSMKVEFTD